MISSMALKSSKLNSKINTVNLQSPLVHEYNWNRVPKIKLRGFYYESYRDHNNIEPEICGPCQGGVSWKLY